MTNDTRPRTRDGRLLRLLDGEAYAALVDAANRECSDRIAGRVWIALGADRVSILFSPDELDLRGSADLEANRRGMMTLRLFVDGQHVSTLDGTHQMGNGDLLHVRWGDALNELMA